MRFKQPIVLDVRLTIMAGVCLSDALKEASTVAKLLNAPVVFEFNGQDVKVQKDGTF